MRSVQRSWRGACSKVFGEGSSGAAVWNLGYQIAATSYDIGPGTPATLGVGALVPPVGSRNLVRG